MEPFLSCCSCLLGHFGPLRTRSSNTSVVGTWGPLSFQFQLCPAPHLGGMQLHASPSPFCSWKQGKWQYGPGWSCSVLPSPSLNMGRSHQRSRSRRSKAEADAVVLWAPAPWPSCAEGRVRMSDRSQQHESELSKRKGTGFATSRRYLHGQMRLLLVPLPWPWFSILNVCVVFCYVMLRSDFLLEGAGKSLPDENPSTADKTVHGMNDHCKSGSLQAWRKCLNSISQKLHISGALLPCSKPCNIQLSFTLQNSR